MVPGAPAIARKSTGPRPDRVPAMSGHLGQIAPLPTSDRAGTTSTAERPESPVPLVQCMGIRKHFGGVKALDGVDFALRPGEVHALLGQNGAGKSTLIKILAGVQQPDSGQILIDGSAVRITDPNTARAMGIGVVYQELSLVPSMSIAANLFLGHEPHGRLGWVHRGEMNRAAERFFEAYDLPLRADTLVQDLPFAYQQLTEIAKALITDARILILDEPTSALSEDEERILFDAIRSVSSSGVGAIYVTHRLAEVFEVAQRVTVLRDGLRAASLETAETDMPSLVAAIVGDEESPAHMLAVSGLGPHGERPTSPDSISISDDDAARARAAHFTVSVMLHTTRSDWARQQIEGITSTLGLYGGEVIETVDCEYDEQLQVQELERSIGVHPDAIIAIPVGGRAIADACRKVTQAGIRLVLMDNAPHGLRAGVDYACVVSADNHGLGRAAAQMLAPHVPEAGCVGIIAYREDFFVTNERETAFRGWMAERRPDVALRHERFVELDEVDGCLRALLAGNSPLDGLFVVWDDPAMRVSAALRGAGQRIPIATIDLGREAALDLASEGLVIGVGAQQPYAQGQAEAQAAILALLGRSVPPWVVLPGVAVTPQNVGEAHRLVWRTPAPPDLSLALEQRSTLGDAVPKEDGGGAPSPIATILELKGVHNDRLHGVDLQVAAGEIVGLAGMVGSGRTEILETVFGLRPVRAGQILFEGGEVRLRNPDDAVALGMGLAPEDRLGQGLVIDHSIERNLALPRLAQLTHLTAFRRRASRTRAAEAIREFSVVAPGPDTRVGDLSGGNQQKVVLGKWREPQPKLLLLDEPTNGVDVGAREQIYELVRATVRAGSGVLAVSSEFAELLLICDRILFVVGGQVVRQVAREEVDSEEHLHRMVQELQQ